MWTLQSPVRSERWAHDTPRASPFPAALWPLTPQRPPPPRLSWSFWTPPPVLPTSISQSSGKDDVEAGGPQGGGAGWAWFQGLLVQAGKATAATEQISNDHGNAKLGARSSRDGGSRGRGGPRAPAPERCPGFPRPRLRGLGAGLSLGLWVEGPACLSLWAARPGHALGRKDPVLPLLLEETGNPQPERVHPEPSCTPVQPDTFSVCC